MLADQQWAREKLAPFAGRMFTLAVGPVRAAWRVREGGTLDAASSAERRSCARHRAVVGAVVPVRSIALE